jgi:TfoX/Sxy family transcriptional regulator of competence genes
MACDEHLVQRIRQTLAAEVGITEKRMFGGVAFLRHGLMFAGVSSSELMARVGPQLYEESLAREFVREMDFTGRPMKGYVYVDEPGLSTDADLHFWLRRCLDFVATLPPKPPRPVVKPTPSRRK